MIHHISIAAHHPARVAAVLAEVMGGVAFPFPPVAGGYIALCEDGHATAIEVYPFATRLVPGRDRVDFVKQENPREYTATHIAISVELDEAGIQAIARREGWRALSCERGGGLFRVVEFWVENRWLVEFLTPEMARDYLQTMTTRKWEGYLKQTG